MEIIRILDVLKVACGIGKISVATLLHIDGFAVMGKHYDKMKKAGAQRLRRRAP